ncbi:MAG TPA: SDR family oxidoreductase [Tepidisphaeraceae bacterium]|jgi:2-deoxy-D-gluconate 3-dehydrogenase|nr:SDR family oxidoreductase [Tepidisphaeraceae bacterium]
MIHSSTKGRFTDKVVVVTGASRGIGESIGLAFAREGAKVVAVARSAMDQPEFDAINFDMASAGQSQMRTLVDQIIAKHGRIDCLVNNAGIIRRAPAVDFGEQDWDDVLHVNLTAPFFLTQAVVKWWLDNGRDASPASSRLKIVNIASLLSFQGGITVPAYAASKHGIAGITKALANEWAKDRINVNAIAPGYISTENTRALRENPTRNQAIKDRIPQGDWGQPDDISGAVLFLTSSDSDYVNGAILNVDGGWLAR